MHEYKFRDKKSLSIISKGTANWKELAKDCVCFANARGGLIIIGIEDNKTLPDSKQIIDKAVPFQIKKKIAERTVNVGLDATVKTAKNEGQYIELKVLQSISTIASTSDGKYYYRSDDTCVPLLPDELQRLLT